MNNDTEAALVQALISNTPEALLRLLTSSSTAEPDAAAAALVEALGKQDALAKALAATTAARRAVAADRAETAAGCFDGRFRSEVGRALVRLSDGESCCIEKIQDEDAREALEHVLRGLGLRPAPRDELAVPARGGVVVQGVAVHRLGHRGLHRRFLRGTTPSHAATSTPSRRPC